MGFVFRIGLLLAAVIITAGFVISRMPDLKQKVVEYINPAAKERRILGELDRTLSDLDATASSISLAASDEEQDEQVQKTRNLISQARGLQTELEEANSKQDGVIKSNLTKIIDSITDDTPYPADHLNIPDKVKEIICKEN